MSQSIRNSSLQILPFSAEDPQEMNGLAASMTGLGLLHKDPAYCYRLEQAGPAYTVRDKGGQVLGCGGVALYWQGVGEGWLILSKESMAYPKSLHKIVGVLADRIKHDAGLHRIQVTVIWSNPTAHHWIRRLGFVHEGWQPGYSMDGTCFARYAWVRDDCLKRWEDNYVGAIVGGTK